MLLKHVKAPWDHAALECFWENLPSFIGLKDKALPATKRAMEWLNRGTIPLFMVKNHSHKSPAKKTSVALPLLNIRHA